MIERHAVTFDRVLRRCRQSAEHGAEGLNLLRGRFFAPDAIALKPERRQSKSGFSIAELSVSSSQSRLLEAACGESEPP